MTWADRVKEDVADVADHLAALAVEWALTADRYEARGVYREAAMCRGKAIGYQVSADKVRAAL